MVLSLQIYKYARGRLYPKGISKSVYLQTSNSVKLKKLKMIGKIIRKIKIFSLLFRLTRAETNDYALGYKVRRIFTSYRENKKIKEEEIFKEIPKP